MTQPASQDHSWDDDQSPWREWFVRNRSASVAWFLSRWPNWGRHRDENQNGSMTWALPLWTLLVWATRIRNVADDDGVGWALVLPVVMTALAVVALLDRRRRRGLLVLAAATIAVWAVRLPFVVVHDHPGGFKVVHAVLALVSITLAMAMWRAGRSQSAPAEDSGTSSSPTVGSRFSRPVSGS